MTTNGRKCVNMIWANEAGVSVYIYEAEHERRTIEIHGVVNDYETVLATATIEKHNRDRLAEAVGNDLQSQLEQLRAENDELTGIIVTHGDTIVKLAERFAQVEQERDTLREKLLSEKALDSLTDRTLKPAVHEAIKKYQGEM